jgi:hypothetical protein
MTISKTMATTIFPVVTGTLSGNRNNPETTNPAKSAIIARIGPGIAWDENTGAMIMSPVALTEAKNHTMSISPFNIAASPHIQRWLLLGEASRKTWRRKFES